MADPTHAAEQRLSATTVMALAAVGAALIAMFGEDDSFTPVTVGFALLGLVPWALMAGGVRIPPLLFVLATVIPAAVIVLVDRNPGGVFPLMLTVVSITRSHGFGAFSALTVASTATIVIALAVIERTTHETGAIYFLGGLATATLAGSMLRRQEVLAAQLSDAHARQATHALAEERTRIAREVHDVVAHSLTVTILHVEGARRALANDPVRAADALERAEQVGRDSLDSIRQVVGLLRAADDDGRSAPLPALADIPELVDGYRAAGLRVEGSVDLAGAEADPATSLAAFRLVQEALANALQHAPGAPVRLDVASDSTAGLLRIVAENPAGSRARSDREGLGLTGMGERVRAVGGSMEAGAVGSTWRVSATLPVRTAGPA